MIVLQTTYLYETDIGKLAISELGGAIVGLHFSLSLPNSRAREIDEQVKESALLKEACSQLKAYFKGKLREFSLPLAPVGTKFQMDVWKALCDIPYGKTASYKDVAVAVGNPKACRAVGNANNKNPISIIIPCHRVIASDGKLAGYGGGIDVKLKLLRLEGVDF